MMFALSVPSVGRTPAFDRSSFCACLLALLGALSFLPSPTAAQTTQTLSLDEGWNLVSLRVQPDDPSFASIFGGRDGAISSVKNEDGAAYLPALGIEQISTWRADEGYKIHAETATTIKIVGAELSPGSVAIALEEGGNIVPYLPDRAQAVEEAVMSIEESLIAVEDEDGRRYPSGSTPLDSLRPGQGYKVYVDRADTLRYPTVVKTLDDALALTGVPVGSQVRVQGYHEPGDGGGGLFRVTDSGAATDGGTVFVFEENVSAQQSFNTGDNVKDTGLPNGDLVWGTVEVQLGTGQGQPSVGTKYLHGHTTKGSSAAFPFLDYGQGKLQDQNFALYGAREWANGSGFTVRYRYATSDRRLERTGVNDAVSIDWWGAKEAGPQNPVNNWWRIAWAVNKAAELYRKGNYDWTYVDIPGEYYYHFTIRIREGVKLRGASNRYEDKTNQTFGSAGNGEPTYGKLTVTPNSQMNYTKDGWIDKNVEFPLRMHKVLLTHAPRATKFGMKSLEVAGNIDKNMGPIKNESGEYGVYKPVQEQLQSTNAWNGFMSRPGGSFVLPEGAEAHFKGVYIHDFPGNGIASGNDGSGGEDNSPNAPHLDWSNSTNVRLGGAQRNHQIYRTAGTHDGWEFDGAAWASLLKYNRATLRDISIDAGPNRLYQYWSNAFWDQVFNHHGKGFGLDWRGDATRISNMKVTADNVDIDLRDGNAKDARVNVHWARGFGGTYKNITINSTPNQIVNYFHPTDTGGNGPIRDYTFQDIEVIDEGGGVKLMKGGPHTHNVIKNFTITTASGVTGKAFSVFFQPELYSSSEYAEKDAGSSIPLGMAARMEIINFTDGRSRGRDIVGIDDVFGTYPYDLFITGSSLSNSGSSRGLLRDRTGSSLQSISEAFRMYLANTEFEVFNALAPGETQDQYTHRFLLNDEQTIRLRNCATPGGLVSEESGTYTSGAGDEGNDYVLISTSLLSRAQERMATVTSGSRTVQSVEVANSDGTLRGWDPSNPVDQREPYLRVNLNAPIQAGNTITVDWTARVTPASDYTTTGLFVTRTVANQSYASGNGPFTIDLRGTMTSQESDAPVQYSASSGDTSVVTATVNAITDPNGTGVSWELDLTEQSTGTATITVTGEIQGVGTAQTTFEVTVE